MRRSIDYRGMLGAANPLPRYPRLYEACLDEFSRRKYQDASLNDVLKAASVSKGSLYHNFGDKFGLYLCLMDIVLKRKTEFFAAFMRQRQASGDFFGTMRTMLAATMGFMFQDGRMHGLFQRNIEAGPELTDRLLPFFPFDWSGSFLPLIRSAVEAGQIDGRFEPEFVARALEILLGNAHRLLGPDRTEPTAVALVDQIMDLVRRGIGAGKETDP